MKQNFKFINGKLGVSDSSSNGWGSIQYLNENINSVIGTEMECLLGDGNELFFHPLENQILISRNQVIIIYQIITLLT